MKTRTLIPRRGRAAAAVIVLVVLVAAGISIYAYMARHGFARAYAQFAQAEEAYETAAYKPAAEKNPVRQEVGYLLSQVLQVPMSDRDRLEMARKGIAHLNDIEGQIDAIKTEGDKVEPLRAALEKSAQSPGNGRQRAKMDEIVSLAKENARIISDIRGLSYRADYYTDEVFERIIDEDGKLSDEHKTYLNDLIPQLEAQFNQRENLYMQLKQNSDKLKKTAAELGY